jgi:hypothetical protein
MQSFDQAAQSLNEDWGTKLDGKQIQRWSEAMGRVVAAERDAEVRAFEQGQRPASPPNPPALMVIGVDGGRVQTGEKQEETGKRKTVWREDKVATITSYLPGDGTEDHPPEPLVTTYVATMDKTDDFGRKVRVEAERRGLRRARIVLLIADAGNWIDPLGERERLYHYRIVDYYHAAEHLYEAARAALGKDTPEFWVLLAQLKNALWEGRLDAVIALLMLHSERLGLPQEGDGADHPRRVLANNVNYFQRHRHQMDYPTYRANGWPIGSGVTESGVKQFNKRVKGTDQFWSVPGVETILSLRALLLSQDGRWERHWDTRQAYPKAA